MASIKIKMYSMEIHKIFNLLIIVRCLYKISRDRARKGSANVKFQTRLKRKN